MSWYDNFVPKTSTLTGAKAATADSKVNFSTTDQESLLESAWKKATDAYGDAKAKFKKLTAGGESLAKIDPVKPQVPGATASSIKAETGTTEAPNNTYHKVKLSASVADGEIRAIRNDPAFQVEPLMERVVEFDIMPEVSEVRNADYEALAAPHMPGEFQKYKGTKATQWTITGVFTCRTRSEALRNYVLLNTLRGWTMPYFGEAQRLQYDGKLGAPPPVLSFSGWRGLVGQVPVVITSLNWTWPRDCDWIPTGIADDKNGQEIPFPTVMNVNINIVESFSPAQFNAFDLRAFRNGRMVGAYGGEISTYTAPTAAEPIGGNQSVKNGTASPQSQNTPSTAVYNSSGGDFARFDRQLTAYNEAKK